MAAASQPPTLINTPVIGLFLLFAGTNLVTSQTSTILTIGAIDAQNETEPMTYQAIQTIGYNATWGSELKVKVIWSIAKVNERFSLLKQVRGFIDTSVDFLVLNDIFYGYLEEKHHFELQDTTVVHYQGQLSPFVSPKTADVSVEPDPWRICGAFSFLKDGISPDSNQCNENNDVHHDDRPIVPDMVDVVFAVLDYLQWKSLVILYEDETALEAMEVSGMLSSDNVTYQVYSVKHYENTIGLHDMLNVIYNKTMTSSNNVINIVLMCSEVCVNKIINKANAFDDVNGKKTAMKLASNWLVVLPHPNNAYVEQCGMDMDNIAVITYPPSNTVSNMTVGLPQTLEKVLRLVGSNNDTNNVTMDDIRHNASVTLMQLLESQAHCWRSDVSTLLWKSGGVRRLSSVGYVNRTGHLNIYSDVEIFPNTNFGFNNRLFNISTNVWEPFVIETNTTEKFEGFCMDLLKELASSLNFSYNLTMPKDKAWGALVNGSFNGLIGQLEREEVDMVVAPLSIEPDREKVVDFIFPYYYEYTTVLIKKPDPNRTKWRTLIDPFKWQVLMCIFIALLGVTTFYFLVERWNPYYEGKKKEKSMFGDAFWYMYGALLTQGGEHLPDSQAGRTVVSCWWLFSIVMAATYSGNLIAFLTVNKDKLPFDTISELVEQTDYIWGTAGGGTYWETMFEVPQKTNKAEFRLAWEGIKRFNATDPSVLSLNPLDHYNKVKEGSYGYIADRSMMERWMAESCDLQMIKENFFPLQYAIALPNNSAYVSIFSEEMMRIYESGLLQIWKKRWWSKNSFCKGSLTTEAKPIILIDVQSAFYLIGIGVVIAAIALGCEWLFRYIKCRKSKPAHMANCNGHSKGHLPKFANGIK
ncbi:glutamate receptor 4-like isoform X1 [Haliotis rufescens]|uniref:glutamate receptor 4-like isoform X1 n=1 Tax=Haliotis rufescens TaxID=6454 RepID=UPI001EB0A31F|nr:glutamate receptor 4-like isoform X1 [Haliotis rufescens]